MKQLNPIIVAISIGGSVALSACNSGGSGGETTAPATTPSAPVVEQQLQPSTHILHISDKNDTPLAFVDPDVAKAWRFPEGKFASPIYSGTYDDTIGGVRNAKTHSLIYIANGISLLPLSKNTAGYGFVTKVSSQPALTQQACTGVTLNDFAAPDKSKYMYVYADDCTTLKNSAARMVQADMQVTDAPQNIIGNFRLISPLRDATGGISGYLINQSGALAVTNRDMAKPVYLKAGVLSLTAAVTWVSAGTTSKGLFLLIDNTLRYVDLKNMSLGPALYSLPSYLALRKTAIDDNNLYLLLNEAPSPIDKTYKSDVVAVPLNGTLPGKVVNQQRLYFRANDIYPAGDFLLLAGAANDPTGSSSSNNLLASLYSNNNNMVESIAKQDGKGFSVLRTNDQMSSISLFTSVKSNNVFYSYPRPLGAPGFSIASGTILADGSGKQEWISSAIAATMSDTMALGYRNVDRVVRYVFDANGAASYASIYDVATLKETYLGNPGIGLGTSGRAFFGSAYGNQGLIAVAEGSGTSTIYDYLLFDGVNQRVKRLSNNLK